MIQIEPLQVSDWTTAMYMALAYVPKETRPDNLEHVLQLLAEGTIDPGAIRIARDEHGEIAGVQVCAPLPGSSCLFWVPTAPDEIADLLVQACLRDCSERGIKIAQAFVKAHDLDRVAPFLRQGFSHVTHMFEMEHALIELPPEVTTSLRFKTFESAPYQDFVTVLQRTYEGTLDCPELNGKRSIDEIIAGHRAEGIFDPSRWCLAYEGSQPVGLTMLAEFRDRSTWDLSYVGVVPEHRRHGHGRALVQHALQFAADEDAGRLIIAVDGRNTPALQLYHSMGFVELDRSEVLLHFLNHQAPG